MTRSAGSGGARRRRRGKPRRRFALQPAAPQRGVIALAAVVPLLMRKLLRPR
ncbi:hypothetical protein [Falsiroseomonas oryzae]|uniref:hypothetical protein n=1 Tax=Falsiroseomonas oryzae TaxID=2766473 RepID=UPI0022EAF279|nr:hypothetical protein [Roseomonas sp. MO-31]